MVTRIPLGLEAVHALLRLPADCRLVGVADDDPDEGSITFVVEDATGAAPDEAMILYRRVKASNGTEFLEFHRFARTPESLTRLREQQAKEARSEAARRGAATRAARRRAAEQGDA